jgi:hypothetical protein
VERTTTVLKKKAPEGSASSSATSIVTIAKNVLDERRPEH